MGVKIGLFNDASFLVVYAACNGFISKSILFPSTVNSQELSTSKHHYMHSVLPNAVRFVLLDEVLF